MVEERVGESAQVVTVAMQGTFEAGTCVCADWRPSIHGDGLGIFRAFFLIWVIIRVVLFIRTVVDIRAEEELEVLARSHATIQRLMAFEGARVDKAIAITGRTAEYTQVIEVLENVKAILSATAVVIDVYLRFDTLVDDFLVVYVVVVFLSIHYLLQVVVVTHTERYGVTVGLAQIGLCIVGNVIVVLIQIYRGQVIIIGLPVGVCLGFILAGENLPTGVGYKIGSLLHGRYLHAYSCSGQYKVGLLQLANFGHTALEIDMDVHDVAFAHWHDIRTRLIAFLVFVEVNNGDNLLLRKVEDVRFARHIQGAGLRRSSTMDGKALLFVRQGIILGSIDDDMVWNFFIHFIGSGCGCSLGFLIISVCPRILFPFRYTNLILTCYGNAFALLIYGIAFTAIVIGDRIIGIDYIVAFTTRRIRQQT